MAGIDKEKRGLHDMLSDTNVIYYHEKKVYVQPNVHYQTINYGQPMPQNPPMHPMNDQQMPHSPSMQPMDCQQISQEQPMHPINDQTISYENNESMDVSENMDNTDCSMTEKSETITNENE